MKINLIPLVTGIIAGALLTPVLLNWLGQAEWWSGHTEHNHSEDYHIHVDFLVVMNGEIIDLSGPEYISTANHKLSEDEHLHDDDGKVEHIHAKNVTFAAFLKTLGITLSNTCLTTDEKAVCQDDSNTLKLYINGDEYSSDLTSYIPSDLDRVLLYAGVNDQTTQDNYLKQVEDRACIFSGSCPERGIAPAESCGLTCEL